MRAWLLGLFATVIAGCWSAPTSQPPSATTAPDAGTPTVSFDAGSTVFTQPPVDLGAACDPTRSVPSDGNALLVRDPDVLSRFSLERALTNIIETAGATMTPVELLQRLFDTESSQATAVFANGTYCDDHENPAFALGKAVDCPRAEARLAASTGLFVPGNPDSFEPVALVNRFDLMASDNSTCGEYRIVYAKHSGKTDPNDRVLLILEGALGNPSLQVKGCRPVAELWASLPTSGNLAESLERFYFEGLEGFAPVLHAKHFGLNAGDCTYGACGQLRLGQGMQAPWEFRQFRLEQQRGDAALPSLSFVPVTDSRSILPELFDPPTSENPANGFQDLFVTGLPSLTVSEVPRLRFESFSAFEAAESAIEGPAQPNYAARAGTALLGRLTTAIAKAAPTCPPNDPLTAESTLRRATALSCAGCHAPDRLIAADRKIGCGQVWPNSLGQAHIDEQGNLSDALTQVFLPYRAKVLSTYLQACDAQAIFMNQEPVREITIVECFAAGTLITMADGSRKAIETIGPGETVLTFDERSRTLLPGNVERAVVRPETDRLVVVNGSLRATANHPFYTARGLVRADSLELGDTLVEARSNDGSLSTEPSAVSTLFLQTGGILTYNLVVGEHHNYFAGGFLVHDRP